MSSPTATAVASLQRRIWDGSLPLEIRLSAAVCRTYDDSVPYLINVPRLSYLPFLLPRLHAFFAPALIDPASTAPHEAWLSFDGLPLKWHYPVGLLYDLFSGATPAGLGSDGAHGGPASPASFSLLTWRLTVHYAAYPEDLLFPLDSSQRVLHDAYINAVKEADFVRNGTAKSVMSLSKADSDALWAAVETHDLLSYERVNVKLWSPPGVGLRHIPVKLYLPTAARHGQNPQGTNEQGQRAPPSQGQNKDDGEDAPRTPQAGIVRVVQGLVPLLTTPPGGRQASVAAGPAAAASATTLGTALNTLLPTVFPSRRNPVLAVPVLHGALVPMSATMGELGRAASYADGFLHIVIVLLS